MFANDLGENVTLAEMVLSHTVQRTLLDEAAALDRRAYREWLDFLTDDISYWVPIRSTRAAEDPSGEFTKRGGPAFYDENRRSLESRIVKLESGWSWSENPPSRTRRFVSNVRVLEVRSDDDVAVESNILLYRSRLDTDVDLWAARRLDEMRRVEGRWKIASRSVFLDQTVLVSNNLGVFF